MQKRLIAILILCCSVSASLSSLFVFAGFEMNQNYIATTLCINRDKPQLHCNGKCYLMRKLKQAQDKEQKQEHQLQKIQLQEAVISLPFLFKQYPFAEINVHIPFTTGMPLSNVIAIFHPPQSICS